MTGFFVKRNQQFSFLTDFFLLFLLVLAMLDEELVKKKPQKPNSNYLGRIT